jgi:hypothetical protein
MIYYDYERANTDVINYFNVQTTKLFRQCRLSGYAFQ